MTKYVLAIATIFCIASAAHAQTTDPYQLVGFTSATFLGDTGVLGFTSACQVEFGPPARMCTSVEVLETVVVPSGLSGVAWVRPVYQPLAMRPHPGSSGFETELVLDASGIDSANDDPGDMSCFGWSEGNTGQRGLAVSAQGQFTRRGCNNIINPPNPAVACCAPIPLPEPSSLFINGAGGAALGAMALSKRAR